jgi:hypothetical protein
MNLEHLLPWTYIERNKKKAVQTEQKVFCFCFSFFKKRVHERAFTSFFRSSFSKKKENQVKVWIIKQAFDGAAV